MTQKKRSLLGKLKRGCVYYPKTIDSGICHVKLGSVNRSFKRNFRRREKKRAVSRIKHIAILWNHAAVDVLLYE